MKPHCSLETVGTALSHLPSSDQCGSAEFSQLICLQISDYSKLLINGDIKKGRQRLTQGHSSVTSLKHRSISLTTGFLHV